MMNLRPVIKSQVSPHRKRWVIIFALIFVFATSLPYWVGFDNQGGDWYFSGFGFAIEDGNTYIAKMLRGAHGDWLFRSPFTAREQRGAFTFFPYLLLGKLTSPPGQHEQLVVIYHLFRMVGGFLSVLATYDFLASFIQNERVRRLGVVWSSLGGGLGWLFVLLGQQKWLGSLPLDFYSPETFGFLGVYGIAHLPWARAMLLWGLRGYLVRGNKQTAVEAPICRLANLPPGLLWLLTGIMQPFTGMIIGVVALVHLTGLVVWQGYRRLQKRSMNSALLKHYLISGLGAGLCALPLVLYNLVTYFTDPYSMTWGQQNQFPPPHPLHYLAAYGLILPFMLVGITVILKKKPVYGILLIGWLGLAPVLVGSNLSGQRRLIEGLWVVLVTLAMVAYEEVRKPWFRRLYWLGIWTLPTTLLLWVGGFGVTKTVQPPVFYPKDEVSAFKYLASYAEDSDVVLTAYDSGNALPAWAPVFVVIGHRPESADYAELAPQVEAFYQGNTSDENRLSFLRDVGADYVFWGPDERVNGSWDPGLAEYLVLVFQEGSYAIYRVVVE